jgi:hypothetical protein
MAAVVVVPSGLPLQFLAFGNSLWMFVQNDGVGGGVQAYLSLDSGNTWTQIDGTGFLSAGWQGSPVVSVYDGADTVTFYYQQGSFSGNTFLQQFNLATQTWGLPFAEQSGGVGGNAHPYGIYLASNGNFVVIFQDSTSSALLMKTQTWSGASWSAAVDMCAGAEALPGFDATKVIFPFISGALDSSNVLHVVYRANSTTLNTWKNRYFYQEITALGVLQNFSEFPGQTVLATQDLAGISPEPTPNLFILGSSIYWGIIRNNYGPGNATFPSAYVGTPVINPAWTELGNLDPAAGALQLPLSAPVWGNNAGQLWELFNRTSPSGVGEQTQAIIAGQSTTLTDSNTGGPILGVGSFGPWIIFSPLIALATGSPPSEGPSTAASFYPVGPSSFSVVITLRGVNRRRCDPAPLELTEVKQAPHVKRAM